MLHVIRIKDEFVFPISWCILFNFLRVLIMRKIKSLWDIFSINIKYDNNCNQPIPICDCGYPLRIRSWICVINLRVMMRS